MDRVFSDVYLLRLNIKFHIFNLLFRVNKFLIKIFDKFVKTFIECNSHLFINPNVINVVSILSLVKKIFLWISVSLLLVAMIILLVGLIQFILFDSGIQLILLGTLIDIFGWLLFIPTKGERRKRIKKRRKRIEEKKEGIETKMEAAPNVTYMLRIEKEIGDSGAERINYICGYCGVKNNLKSIDEEHGIFQCLNCGAENHLLK